jgi:hypothetical protein
MLATSAGLIDSGGETVLARSTDDGWAWCQPAMESQGYVGVGFREALV